MERRSKVSIDGGGGDDSCEEGHKGTGTGTGTGTEGGGMGGGSGARDSAKRRSGRGSKGRKEEDGDLNASMHTGGDTGGGKFNPGTTQFNSGNSTGEQYNGLNWKSLCSPAILPVTTDYCPKVADLVKNYKIQTNYDIIIDRNECPYLTPEALLAEMVCQRLGQDFQLVVDVDTGPYLRWLMSMTISGGVSNAAAATTATATATATASGGGGTASVPANAPKRGGGPLSVSQHRERDDGFGSSQRRGGQAQGSEAKARGSVALPPPPLSLVVAPAVMLREALLVLPVTVAIIF